MVVVIVMALNPLGCRCDRKRQPVADQTLADVIVTKTSDAVTLTDLLAERERLARAVKKRQRAQQMIEVGDYEGALPLLRELEDTLPDDSVRLTLLAEALARARPLATSRLRTGPETPEALIYLHRLCLQEEAVACAALRKKPAVAALMKRVPEFEAVLDAHKKRLPRGRLDLALKSQRQVGSVLHEMFGAPVLDLVVGHFDGHKSPSVALRFARWPSVVYLATRRSKGWRLHYVSHTYGRGSYRIALRKLSVGVDRDLLWLRYTGYESEYDGNDVHVLIQAAPAPIVSACLFTTRYREDPSGGL
ncbi:MAG: hypothetical protein KC609_22595, partial [Myxococcales bacterium]|nr:hypothetical protein [Myxococcales bacterium]